MTETQVEEIATLIAKEIYHKDHRPTGASYDSKSGVWTCLIHGPEIGGGLFINIRDKDAYYKVLVEGKTIQAVGFKMHTILKRRIEKIATKNG